MPGAHCSFRGSHGPSPQSSPRRGHVQRVHPVRRRGPRLLVVRRPAPRRLNHPPPNQGRIRQPLFHRLRSPRTRLTPPPARPRPSRQPRLLRLRTHHLHLPTHRSLRRTPRLADQAPPIRTAVGRSGPRIGGVVSAQARGCPPWQWVWLGHLTSGAP
jgi:hypothetical protein